jgi:menaquinol-cytochrome c reductase iron-sulfur subunit
MSENSASFFESEPPRRSFLTRALALLLGGVAGLVPLAAGLASFLNPLRKSVQAKQRPTGSDADGYYKAAPLEAISEIPQAFKIIADRKDAWNVFPKEAIGAVYLQRLADGQLRAFNVQCPHAGCAVDYRVSRSAYYCPCHNSSFSAEGQRSDNSPAARDLDSLDWKIVDGKEVWVQFMNFKTASEEKKRV